MFLKGRSALAATLASLLGAGCGGASPASHDVDVADDTAVDTAGDALPIDGDAGAEDAEVGDDSAADGSPDDVPGVPDVTDASSDGDGGDVTTPDAASDAASDAGVDLSPEDTAADSADADGASDGAEADVVADSAADGCDGAECVDAGPFDDLLALEGVVLLEALASRIDDHVSLGYNAARDVMFNDLDVIDGFVECFYTGVHVPADGTRTPGDGLFNTEHAWPRSHGADREPALSDLHHLFPVTARSNNARSDFYYGETACDQTAACGWFDSGSERGVSVVDGSTIFEVRAATRGDAARAQFYFAVRYGLAIPPATELALRSWNAEDPPDERERARNEAIYLLQENRNPFVDHPSLVDRIEDF